MRVFEQGESHLICGHWNGSPVEIGVTRTLTAPPLSEVEHGHEYHEYYIVLEGEAELRVEGHSVPLRAGTVVMVEPGERHFVASVSPSGVRWVLIKERSLPDSKLISRPGAA